MYKDFIFLISADLRVAHRVSQSRESMNIYLFLSYYKLIMNVLSILRLRLLLERK